MKEDIFSAIALTNETSFINSFVKKNHTPIHPVALKLNMILHIRVIINNVGITVKITGFKKSS
jgi:hypothetical protein